MTSVHSPWIIVLAGGDGTRLASLTSGHAGAVVPKQFCSLRGGTTLLADALARATAITPAARVLAVVTEKHRPYWWDEFDCLPPENVIVQPHNRGTALGVLLPLLEIQRRDPLAEVALMPSDHHVRDEAVLRIALLLALQFVDKHSDTVCMLGLSPDSANTEYGWIVPEAGETTLRRVERFVEKPAPELASLLLQQGALWNSFLLAGSGRAFVNLYRRRLPALLSALSAVLRVQPEERGDELLAVYDDFAPADFSRELMQGSEAHLRVLEVPPCGWTDLGTPERVSACLRTGHYGRMAPSLSDDTPVLFERLSAIRRQNRAMRRQRVQGA